MLSALSRDDRDESAAAAGAGQCDPNDENRRVTSKRPSRPRVSATAASVAMSPTAIAVSAQLCGSRVTRLAPCIACKIAQEQRSART